MHPGSPDFSSETLARLDDLHRSGSPDDYGRTLFDAAFRGDCATEMRRLLAGIADGGPAPRLRLHIDREAPELHRLRWESLMHDHPDAPPRRLGASRSTPLSRFHAGGPSFLPPPASRPRLLVVIASPENLGRGDWAGYPPIDADAEASSLADALDDLGPRIDYEIQREASYWAIRRRLQEKAFHVLHLVSHAFAEADGGDCGLVLLGARDRRATPAGQQVVVDMLRDLEHLRLVVLTGCHGSQPMQSGALRGVASALVREAVPVAIATGETLSAPAGARFARRLYQALLDRRGGTDYVDVAVNEVREVLRADAAWRDWNWCAPVLAMRGDGRLFERFEAVSRA